MSRKRFALVAMAALAGASAAQGAIVGNSLSLNFVGGDPNFPGQSLDPTDLAGVIPSRNWNNLAGPSGTMTNLVADINGTATPLPGSSFSWSSNGTWSTDDEGNTSQFVNPADEKLMSGYIDTFEGSPQTLSFTGLPNGTYNVIVYTLTAVNNRDSGNIGVAGVNKKSSSIISTVFVEGGGPGGDDDVGALPGNYNLYPGVVVSNGTLDINLNAQTFRTAVNGIQIYDPTTVPEPVGLGFIGLCAAMLLGRRRRA